MTEPLASIAFSGPVIEWRGPAPYYFVAVPDELCDDIRDAARLASYGWGCVPVQAEIGGMPFRTSLIPRDGTYLLPLRIDIRRKADIVPGAEVAVTLTVSAKR